jgi:hypothetical protein
MEGVCNHAHEWSCKSCSALDRLCEDIAVYIKTLLAKNAEQTSGLQSMITCLKRVRGQMLRYVKHAARALWQHARIADTIISVSRDPAARSSVLFVDLDHKQKVLG